MLAGDPIGINIYNKLGNSQVKEDQEYFQRVFNAAGKWRQAFFSDISEQRKKRLNNQNIYLLHVQNDTWRVDLFHKVTNEV